MDPDWLPYHPSPRRPAFPLPDGTVDAHCHVFGPGRRFPYAAERKYTPCDAGKEELFRVRDHLGVTGTSSCRLPVTGLTQRAGGRAALLGRPRPRRGDGARRCHRRRPHRTARGRGARRWFNRPPPGQSPTRPLLPRHHRADHPPRLARRGLLRGRGPHRTLEFPDFPADHRRRRPPWAPGCGQARGRPRLRAVPDPAARPPAVLGEGDLPRPAHPQRPARLRRRRPVRPYRGRGVPGPRAVGHRLAAPEPEEPHARRRGARRLHPAGRPTGPQRTTPRRQSDPTVLEDDESTITKTSTTSPAPSSSPARNPDGVSS